jgi:hypothetical protein
MASRTCPEFGKLSYLMKSEIFTPHELLARYHMLTARRNIFRGSISLPTVRNAVLGSTEL